MGFQHSFGAFARGSKKVVRLNRKTGLLSTPALLAALIAENAFAAAPTDGMVQLSSLNGVSAVTRLEDGTLRITLATGKQFDLPPGQYTLVGDVVYVTPEVAGQVAAAANAAVGAAAGGGIDLGWVALGAAGVGGIVAVAASGGRDEPPVITSASTATLPENSTGAAITVVATDPDSRTLTYSISGGTDAARFRIDAGTGALSFVSAPDFETAADTDRDNVYDVIVGASDGNQSVTQTVRVTVTNVNDVAPVITSGTAVQVAENTAATGYVATATDVERDTITYSITGGADAALFAINAQTGALSFISARDFETASDADRNNIYEVTIGANDGNQTVTQAVRVTVTNVNDVAPVITSGTAVQVAENTTVTGYVATATDAERDTITYSISGGADAALFAINAQTGALSFVAARDFENAADANRDNIYDVTVGANDGARTVTQAVRVTVTNVNDIAPVITSASSVLMPDGTTATSYVAAATDAEGDTISFAIASGSDAALFAIDARTGVLSFVAAPDAEAPLDANRDGTYDIVISAADGVNSATRAVAVQVVERPGLALSLASDTGTSSTDAITANAAIAGTLDGPIIGKDVAVGLGTAPANFVSIANAVQADGSFLLSTAQIEAALGAPLAQGAQVISVRYQGAFDTLLTDSVSFTYDTVAPGFTAAGLAITSDTGEIGDLVTGARKVTLVGQGEALAQVRFAAASDDAVASTVNVKGTFSLNDVRLADGSNAFTIILTDAAGNTAERDLSVAYSTLESFDPVLFWNAVTLQAIVNDASPPTFASRALAMQSVAVNDALAAIAATTPFMVSVAGDATADPGVAVAYASATVLAYLYPRQAEAILDILADQLAGKSGSAAEAGETLGTRVGALVVAIRDADGWNAFATSPGGTGLGEWAPTEPSFAPALDPQWANLKPFTMASPDAFLPGAPPALGSEAYTAAYAQVADLGSATSTTRTADQTQIANFWRANPGTVTPPGMWNQIASQVMTAEGDSYGANARSLALLNLAMADAGISVWNTKYAYDFWRPIQAIRAGDADGNDATVGDADWTPLLITPNFPEYLSGHATFSGAAATILSALFGNDYAFSFQSQTVAGATRSFDSFDDASAEAGMSRIYGGIHFDFSSEIGQQIGESVATNALQVLTSGVDTTPPNLIFTTAQNQTFGLSGVLSGFALDVLSGLASLSGTIDGQAVTVPIDADGRFSLPLVTAGGSIANGAHNLELTAVDGVGNTATATLTFNTDTTAPAIALTSFTSGAALAAGARLTGSVDPTGSALVGLSYTIDGGAAIPLSFDGTAGTFDTALGLGQLLAGDHQVVLRATDAGGNTTSQSHDFRLDSAIPLTVVSVSPADGANEVGVTQQPKVVFSRPVDPDTVTAASFFATDTNGVVMPANIVVSNDHTTAYLFFEDPMNGLETFTLHLDGAVIAAEFGGQTLDGDGDGTAGGEFTSTYTTVGTVAVPGTVITGFVVGPGNDLKPMTQDDFRSGPDGIPHTADDLFLERLAGAKVFILGRENEAVLTDANGNFTLTNVPAGNVKLAIDGRTATNAPAGSFYPEMVMDLEIRPGIVNTVMGSMGSVAEQLANFTRGEVYLPRLSNAILTDISDTEPTIVTLVPEASQGLSPDQASRLTLTVQPGSIVDINGNPVLNPQVGIATVPPELVRDMLPPGILEHTFDITIQVPDGAVFTEPAVITLPNVFGAAPGTKLNILSFDHTTGRLVINGTGTVSADGLTVVSDPGAGITMPGWHGLTPPGVILQILGDLLSGFRELVIPSAQAAEAASDSLNLPDGVAVSPIDTTNDKVKSVNQEILDQTSAVRDAWKVVFGEDSITKISSGKRDGSGKSQHDHGEALDFKLDPGITPETRDEIIREIKARLPEGYRVGAVNPDGTKPPSADFRDPGSPNHIHIDNGNLGVPIGGPQVQNINRFAIQAADLLSDQQTKVVINFSESYHLITDLETGGIISRGPLSNLLEVFIASNSRFLLEILDPISGALVRVNFDTGQSGERIDFDDLFSPVTFSEFSEESGEIETGEYFLYDIEYPNKDSDGDALTDVFERILGTNSATVDTDGDGISDKIELDNGLDPLSGVPTATGILATVQLGGAVNEIVTLSQGASVFAVAAIGAAGVALIDITQPFMPVSVAALDLPGNAVDVDVDAALGIAAVATGSDGLQIVDANLRLIHSVSGNATQVEVIDGTAVAVMNGNLVRVDLLSGDVLQTRVPAGGAVRALTSDGTKFYALSESGTLEVLEIANGALVSRGTLSLSGQPWLSSLQSNKLFAADGVLYIPADRGFEAGYATIDVSNPAAMAVISGPDDPAVVGGDIALNGSGLGIVVGEAGGVFGATGIDIVRTNDPTNTGSFVTRFAMQTVPTAVAIGAGLAFVGDQNGNFHVVNYQAFDVNGVPPVVAISRLPIDVDLATPGLQVQEGQTIALGITATDDAQVRSVQLIVNGVARPADVAYPWDLTVALPSIAENGGNQVTLQVRATDSGGNTALSDLVTLDLVPDTIAPQLLATNLADGTAVSQRFQTVRLTFDEALGPVPVEAVSILAADGSTIAAQQVTLTDGGQVVNVRFPELMFGTYTLVIDERLIADRAENAFGDGTIQSSFQVVESQFAGKEFTYQYLFSTISTPFADPLEIVAGEGIEVQRTGNSNFTSYYAFGFNVDIQDDKIVINYLESVSWSNGSFNGFVLKDTGDNIADFISAFDADPRTTITVDANNIYVNWQSQRFMPGDTIEIEVVTADADPIVIDLEGDGFAFLTGDHAVRFDLDNDGFKEAISWLSAGDGLLVLDADASGQIENGREVVSNHFLGQDFASSLEALKSLDTNNDGLLTADDDRFDDLKLWVDADGNGESAGGELASLASYGIVSLSLATVSQHTVIDQQLLTAVGEVNFSSGKQVEFAEVLLSAPRKAFSFGSDEQLLPLDAPNAASLVDGPVPETAFTPHRVDAIVPMPDLVNEGLG